MNQTTKTILLYLIVAIHNLHAHTLQQIILEQQCAYLDTHLFHAAPQSPLLRKVIQASIASLVSGGTMLFLQTAIPRWLAPDIKVKKNKNSIKTKIHFSALNMLMRALKEKCGYIKSRIQKATHKKTDRSKKKVKRSSQLAQGPTFMEIITYVTTFISTTAAFYNVFELLFNKPLTTRSQLVVFIADWQNHKPNTPHEIHHTYDLIAELYKHDTNLNDINDHLIDQILESTYHYVNQLCQQAA